VPMRLPRVNRCRCKAKVRATKKELVGCTLLLFADFDRE